MEKSSVWDFLNAATRVILRRLIHFRQISFNINTLSLAKNQSRLTAAARTHFDFRHGKMFYSLACAFTEKNSTGANSTGSTGRQAGCPPFCLAKPPQSKSSQNQTVRGEGLEIRRVDGRQFRAATNRHRRNHAIGQRAGTASGLVEQTRG